MRKCTGLHSNIVLILILFYSENAIPLLKRASRPQRVGKGSIPGQYVLDFKQKDLVFEQVLSRHIPFLPLSVSFHQ